MSTRSIEDNIFLISRKWETEGFIIKDAIISDIENIQNLYEESRYLRKWDGHDEDPKNYILNCLNNGLLPPGGDKKYYRIQPIYSKESNQMIGYITFYQGYPSKDVIYIEFFYISIQYQNKGIGQEIINEFFNKAKECNFNFIRLIVALKNWSGLRFWSQIGFNSVKGIYGDKSYGENAYCDMELEKELTRN